MMARIQTLCARILETVTGRADTVAEILLVVDTIAEKIVDAHSRSKP